MYFASFSVAAILIVGVVESEKTAILMHGYSLCGIAPSYIWIATGGKSGCRWYEDTSIVFRDRKIILFPDLGAYEEWDEKSKKIKNCTITTSTILEDGGATAEERKAGLDIADYYLRLAPVKLSRKSIDHSVSPPKTDKDIMKELKIKNPYLEQLVNVFDLVPVEISKLTTYEIVPKEEKKR